MAVQLPAPLPEDEQRFVRAGIACTDLIAHPKSWINRRVETVEMLSHEETRRRVSIDFTLSDEQLDDLHVRDGIVVPLSVLTKAPRRNFHLRDESGRSVPVLGKHQNGDLAHLAVINAAYAALPKGTSSETFELLAADLREIVCTPQTDAEKALGYFIGRAESGDLWRTPIWEDATCRSLLDALWSNYVLFAVLTPGSANRRVLKYSYADDFDLDPPVRARLTLRELPRRAWRPDRIPLAIEYPAAWRATSFHAEIAIPEELRFENVLLLDSAFEESLSDLQSEVNRAALYASDLDDEQPAIAFAEIVAERTGRPFQAASTSVVVAGLLWLGVASGLDSQQPGPAVSILLAGAALFSGVAASQGKHRLVKKIFAAPRRWLALVPITAVSASACLAMEIPSAHPVALWRILAIGCTLAAVRLTWSAIRASA